MASRKHQRGFTIIEILISVSILLLLIGIIVPSFSSFRRMVVVRTAVENTSALLERARIETTASYGASQYGVHFESDRVVYFKGGTYSASDPDNETYELDQTLSISTIDLNGGGDDVVFSRLTGATDAYGTLTFMTTDNASTTINIYQSGTIDINE